VANYRAWQQLVDAERSQPDTPWFRPADNPRLQTPMSPLPFSVPGFGSLVVEFGAGLGQDTRYQRHSRSGCVSVSGFVEMRLVKRCVYSTCA